MSDQLTPSDSTVDQAAAGAAAADAAPSPANPSRRSLLRAAGVGGAVIAVGAAAAACSTSSNGSPSNPVSASSAGGATAPSSAAATGASGGGNGTALWATSQIPLKGGMINGSADGGIVVTQPSSGEFKAFTSVCTHMQCTVGSVNNNVITCPCHGSEYSAVDGSVINGPAPKPLAAKNINISGGNIYPA
jgi:Rieske Fe-S protein